MNFKTPVLMFFKLILVGSFLFGLLLSQEDKKERVNNNAELTEKDIKIIKNFPLVPQYDISPYSGSKINPAWAYSRKFYDSKEIISQKPILKKRVEQAIVYRETGNIEDFSSILIDVITRNNFNEEAAWAALLLGDFELLIYNLEEAAKYYRYVVNVHFNSGFGLGGVYKMAFTLDRMGHWNDAEKLLLLIFNYNREVDSSYKENDDAVKRETKKYLSDRYGEWSRWYWEQKDVNKSAIYYRKYLELAGSKL